MSVCLPVAFLLMSVSCHAPQVLEAAQQLAACNHKVKNLKLEAQGIPAADLEGLGDALVTLPYVTWLTLNLLFSAPRPRKTAQQRQQEWQQEAAQLQQDLQLEQNQQEIQQWQQQQQAAAGQQDNGPLPTHVLAAMAPAGAEAVAEIKAQQRQEERQQEQASREAVHAGSRLSQKLLKQLPGTVLELRIKHFFV